MKKYIFLILLVSISLVSKENYLASGIIQNATEIYLKPNFNSKIIGKVLKNDKVKVYKRSNKKHETREAKEYWFKIKTVKGIYGWVYGLYIDDFHDFKWKTYKEVNKLFFITKDWHRMDPLDEGSEKTIITMNYPSIWYIEKGDNIFYDFKGRKRVELGDWVFLKRSSPFNLKMYTKDRFKPYRKSIFNQIVWHIVTIKTKVSGGYPSWYQDVIITKYLFVNSGLMYDIEFWSVKYKASYEKIYSKMINSFKYKYIKE